MPIFSYSFMMNMVLATAYFVNPLRASQAGLGTWMVVGQLWTGCTVYMLAGLALSRIIEERHNRNLITIGALLEAASCLGCILFPQNGLLFLWIALIAIGHACFSIGFQAFMRAADRSGGGPCAATGYYIFSFSMGFSLAPALNGLLMDYLDWRLCYAYCAIFALATGLALRARSAAPATADSAPSPAAGNWSAYAARPSLVWVGWAIALSVTLTHFGFFKSNFNLQGVRLGFSNSQIGLVHFTHAIGQGIVGLLLTRSRAWMYNPLPVGGVLACGLASMLVFMLGARPAHFMFGSVLTGVFGGCGIFLMIFYAIVHPLRSSRNVSINEFIVGFGGISGNTLALGNAWITQPRYTELYPAAMALIVAVLIFQQYYMLLRARAKPIAAG